MRTNKFLYYDDTLDIVIKKEDLNKFEKIENDVKKFAHIFKMNGPIFYKIFCRNNFTKLIKTENYTWPFINIFVYEYSDSKINLLAEKTFIENISDKTKMVQIKSHNNNLLYNTRIFKESEKILDKLYPDWKKICSSPYRNNRLELNNIDIYSFNCKNIIPDYENDKVESNESNESNKIENYNKIYTKININFRRNIVIICILSVLFLSFFILSIYFYIKIKNTEK